MTAGELAALRRQIGGCWRLPIGVEGIEDMVVSLRIEVRPDARLQIVWVGHALVGEIARELHRDDPRAPNEVGVLSFKREVVRFLDAALGSSFRAG